MVIGTGAAVAALALLPGVASAAPPDTPPGQAGTTPGQSEERGCRDNGQAISGAASGPGAFGEGVRQAAAIADENANFFGELCGDDETQE
jgi:hypothetical protein